MLAIIWDQQKYNTHPTPTPTQNENMSVFSKFLHFPLRSFSLLYEHLPRPAYVSGNICPHYSATTRNLWTNPVWIKNYINLQPPIITGFSIGCPIISCFIMLIQGRHLLEACNSVANPDKPSSFGCIGLGLSQVTGVLFVYAGLLVFSMHSLGFSITTFRVLYFPPGRSSPLPAHARCLFAVTPA